MPRIQLIVTGKMEQLALHHSLRQLFPDHKDGEPIVWNQPRYVDGITTNKLAADGEPSRAMKVMATTLIDEAEFGKKGGPADLIIAVDDVELANLGQESVIAEKFRAAINEEVKRRCASAPHETRLRKILRENCSFHLLKPMIESYIFGDATALSSAGVPPETRPMLRHFSDMEEFESCDPQWLAICVEANESHRPIRPWWQQEKHPKFYLEHLVGRGDSVYTETGTGKDALRNLNWRIVPRIETDVPIIRSLFEDISDWYEIGNQIGPGLLHSVVFPAKHIRPASLLLRNM